MASKRSTRFPARRTLIDYHAVSVSVDSEGGATVRVSTMDRTSRRMVHENLLVLEVDDASLQDVMALLSSGIQAWASRYPTQLELGAPTPQEGD